MAKESSWRCSDCYTSVFPNYSLTRPKSTFRQNCVSLFPIQTTCTYVNLGLIGNKTGQRKQTQLVMVIRDSHLQFDKTKSALRQTCVNSFAIQTSFTYVDLIIVRNINGQRKQKQWLLHIRIFQLQLDKTKINIQTELRELIANINPDKMHLC